MSFRLTDSSNSDQKGGSVHQNAFSDDENVDKYLYLDDLEARYQINWQIYNQYFTPINSSFFQQF